MVELVDTQDLKSCGRIGRAGSIPAPGTWIEKRISALFLSPFWTFNEIYA